MYVLGFSERPHANMQQTCTGATAANGKRVRLSTTSNENREDFDVLFHTKKTLAQQRV